MFAQHIYNNIILFQTLIPIRFTFGKSLFPLLNLILNNNINMIIVFIKFFFNYCVKIEECYGLSCLSNFLFYFRWGFKNSRFWGWSFYFFVITNNHVKLNVFIFVFAVILNVNVKLNVTCMLKLNKIPWWRKEWYHIYLINKLSTIIMQNRLCGTISVEKFQ